MTGERRRRIALALVVIGGSIVSGLCINSFIHGMTYQRDYWDASQFALLFYGGLTAALLGTVASVLLRTAHVILSPFRLAAMTLLILHLGGWLFMSSVTIRTAWHSVARRAVLVGMERDLPPAPSR